jgi:hypothetical protein
VDQVESRAVGFVAQLKGRLTLGRYTVATIFVDHYSRIGYVHLQKDSSSLETLKAKHAWELYARERGIIVRNYHADNGRFVDNAWKNSLLEENQGIAYCGVNAHWQNGIAERRIRELKEQSRTMLIHAEHHWPDAVNTSLWPNAMRNACSLFNDSTTLKGPHKDKTPSEVFSGINIAAETRHHHTFGCPVYVTATQIQARKSLPAWMSRAKVGINLGISPTHARSMALVLSLKTGLVSPQFHVKHDDLFETTGYKAGRFGIPTSRWQVLAGFEKGTVSVTKQQDPAERLTKEAGRLPRADKSVEANINRRRMDDDADIDNTGPSDDMEVATVSVAPDPGDIDEEASISIDEPIDEEPAVTTRSGRKVKVTTRMKESQYQRAKKWVSWAAHALRPPTLSEEDVIYELFGTGVRHTR